MGKTVATENRQSSTIFLGLGHIYFSLILNEQSVFLPF